jgi:hypothetical protein
LGTKSVVKINCPECNLPINAQVQGEYGKFLLYVCPRCKSNVIFYDNKVDVVSDNILKKLIRKKKLRYCGIVDSIPMETGRGKGLSKESVTDLKILLETSQDVDDFLSKI